MSSVGRDRKALRHGGPRFPAPATLVGQEEPHHSLRKEAQVRQVASLLDACPRASTLRRCAEATIGTEQEVHLNLSQDVFVLADPC